MKCTEAQDKLAAYAWAELSESEMEKMRGHLTQCSECRAEFDAIRSAKDSLELLKTDEHTPDLVAAVRRRLDDEKSRRHFVLHPQYAAMIVVAVVGLILTASWLLQKPTAPETTIAVQTPATPPKPKVEQKIVVPDRPLPKPEVQTANAPVHVQTVKALSHRYSSSRPKVRRVPRVDHPVPAPEIHLVVAPRKPESFVITAESAENQSTPQCAVTRHFDNGGGLRSVVITDISTTNGERKPDNERLPDAGPGGEQKSQKSNGGSIYDA